jgi:hypothetical protein
MVPQSAPPTLASPSMLAGAGGGQGPQSIRPPASPRATGFNSQSRQPNAEANRPVFLPPTQIPAMAPQWSTPAGGDAAPNSPQPTTPQQQRQQQNDGRLVRADSPGMPTVTRAVDPATGHEIYYQAQRPDASNSANPWQPQTATQPLQARANQPMALGNPASAEPGVAHFEGGIEKPPVSRGYDYPGPSVR